MTFQYRIVFQQVEESLIQYGAQHLPPDQIRVALDFYKTFAERELTDALSFALLRDVVFYSGFRAATVTARMNTIKCWLPIGVQLQITAMLMWQKSCPIRA